MPRTSIRSVGDDALATTILRLRDDWGLSDRDPAVLEMTGKALGALGNRMTRGVREVLRRVEKEGGIEAHPTLGRIFGAALRIKEFGSPDTIYQGLSRLPAAKEEQRYAF